MAALATSASLTSCIASSPLGASVYSSVGSSPRTVYFARGHTQATMGRWKLVTASSGESGRHEERQVSDDITEERLEEKKSSDDKTETSAGRSFLSATTAAALSICILSGVEVEFAMADRATGLTRPITNDVTNLEEKTGNLQGPGQNYSEAPGLAVVG